MRFQSVAITAVAALSATVYAQDGINTSNLPKFESDFLNYVTATLLENASVLGELLALETDSSAIGALTSLEANLPAVATEGAAAQSSLFAALPTGVRGLASTIVAAATSIEVADGVVSASGSSAGATGAKASSSGSSSAASASSTGNAATRDTIERGLLAGSLMGVVGLMAAL